MSPSAPGHSAAPIGNITNLYNALLKAGVVPASTTPIGAGETAKLDESKPKPVNPVKTMSREYRRAIFSQKSSYLVPRLPRTPLSYNYVSLIDNRFFKNVDEASFILYDQFPVQCKQRGNRFAGNSASKKEMQDHLDMHFRQNRKANQNAGRSHSRSRFMGFDVRVRLYTMP
jgi:pre-mRNA cleavage complex 2 protein Pcf11